MSFIRKLFAPERLPLVSTIVICILMYALASMKFDNFFTASQFINFFRNNVYVGIVSVGMTFVILSGGIDLSVGAVIGFTSIVYATLVMQFNFDPVWTIPMLLALTALMGAGMGALVHYFKIPPFLITLAGMFMYRGLALVISTNQVPADVKIKPMLEYFRWMVREGGAGRPQITIGVDLYIFAALFIFGILLQTWSTWGRSMFAIGGSEQSALLMGLPVARNKILAYAFSGLCAGLAGLAYVFNSSGHALKGSGLELDAITVVVIGGTLLSGGSGSLWGTLFGLLMYAIINEVVDSRISSDSIIAKHQSAWLRIFIGLLLLGFILLQKLLQLIRRKSSA